VKGKKLKKFCNVAGKLGRILTIVGISKNELVASNKDGQFLICNEGLPIGQSDATMRLPDLKKIAARFGDNDNVKVSLDESFIVFDRGDITCSTERIDEQITYLVPYSDIIKIEWPFDKVLHVLNHDQYRLYQVLIESDAGTSRIIATDGHRLVFPVVSQNGYTDFEFRVPGIAVEALACIGKIRDTTIDESGEFASFDSGEFTVITESYNCNFPNWEAVIPKTKHEFEFVANRKDAIKIVKGFTGTTQFVKLDIRDDKIIIESHDDSGIKIKGKIKGELRENQIVIGFNHKYLLDALRFSDNLNVSIKGRSYFDTVIFDNDYALMPSKL
jgi:hypothetical protein